MQKFAKVTSLQCVHILSPDSKTPLIIESRGSHSEEGLSVISQGDVTFKIDRDWEARCNDMHIVTNSCIEDTAKRRLINAESFELMTSNMICVSKKVRIQSSVEPLELQSLNHTRNAIIMRCPKGGITLASGTAGINGSTTGNINLQLETENSIMYLGAHGKKSQTIHIGTENGSTVVHSDLTINGKLRLSDAALIEKHVSTTIETSNVLNMRCDRSDIPYDYGIISNRHDGTQSGIVFDHMQDTFYFAKRLGTYKHTAFSPPLAYANVGVGQLKAHQKVISPSIDTHHLKCKVLQHPQKLVINTPVVQFTNDAHARSLSCSETLRTDTLHAVHAHTHSLSSDTIAARDVIVHGHCLLGQNLNLNAWLANTVGPYGAHRTLQDGLDDSDVKCETFCMQAGCTHNCTAMVNQEICVVNGNNSTLTGVLEVTHTCTRLVIQDAVCEDLTIHSSEEYTKEYGANTVVVLRNVTGTLKDWSLNVADGAVCIQRADVTFKNPMLGTLKTIDVVHSRVRGTPWHKIESVTETSI
jgi:hypothetical protein